MITSWEYIEDRDKIRTSVKKHIIDNNLKSIDVGANMLYWSYPECKFSADILEVVREGNTHFTLDLQKKESYAQLIDYVKTNGKFDFSICSHTLEDIFNPLDLIELLQTISTSGFVAVPSKFDEFSYLYGNKYLGNAHHKHIFDIIDQTVVVFPKFSFIETSDRTDQIRNNYKGREIMFFWQKEIPCKIFGNKLPFTSDGELINAYFNELNRS